MSLIMEQNHIIDNSMSSGVAHNRQAVNRQSILFGEVSIYAAYLIQPQLPPTNSAHCIALMSTFIAASPP